MIVIGSLRSNNKIPILKKKKKKKLATLHSVCTKKGPTKALFCPLAIQFIWNTGFIKDILITFVMALSSLTSREKHDNLNDKSNYNNGIVLFPKYKFY